MLQVLIPVLGSTRALLVKYVVGPKLDAKNNRKKTLIR